MSERIVTLNGHLPVLVVRSPTCSHCGQDVEIEDGYPYCTGCLVQWDEVDDGLVSEVNENLVDDPEDRCGVVRERPLATGNPRYVPQDPRPCILPAGHTTKDHLCPYDVVIEAEGADR